MTPEYRLVVALSGRNEDAALVRYANALVELNRDAGDVPRRRRAETGPEVQGAVVVDEADGLVLSAPQAVEFVDVSSGQAIDRLLALAANAETAAVLVGEALGRRPLQTLVRRAACSIWFVPNGADPDLRSILVPVDFSVRAAYCLRVATALARLRNAAECLALHAYFNDSPLADAAFDRAIRTQLVEEYARFAGPIDTLEVPVTPLFRECPNVARAIHEVAGETDADLVVLSSRGRTWAANLLQDSLAEQTLRECQVPMLVVKHFGARLGVLQLLRDPAFCRRNAVRFS